ncbi:hypothetical protein EVAR_21336_1 [Eumeta japonica]|uniref:Uncharacterized protein n=1 Tax=Eumeta variegata TaxID=151549 RepID=A0A4C1ZR32_EUMVA|nr:hypothetical protein EVAR_21336_1 [Eumeta japonica]
MIEMHNGSFRSNQEPSINIDVGKNYRACRRGDLNDERHKPRRCRRARRPGQVTGALDENVTWNRRGAKSYTTTRYRVAETGGDTWGRWSGTGFADPPRTSSSGVLIVMTRGLGNRSPTYTTLRIERACGAVDLNTAPNDNLTENITPATAQTLFGVVADNADRI